MRIEPFSSQAMPTRPISPLVDDSPQSYRGGSVERKARFWDRIASQYAADPIADLAGYENTLRRVQSLLSADQDVLEIGCGTGTTALRLAPYTRRLVATDISIGMIEIARVKLAAQPLRNLTFGVADADTPLAGDGTFDAVLAFNVLHLVTDLDHTVHAAKQALRPGGLLISKTACIDELSLWIRYLALPLMRAVGKAPQVLCFDSAALQAAMVRQGMEIVSVERHGTRGKDFRVFIVARKPT